MQLAGEGVVLVHRTGVVAGLPAQHRHQIGQQPAGLAKGESNGVPAIDQPAPPDPRIMMCSSDVQAEPSQFRCAADNVAGAAQHRTRQTGSKCGPGTLFRKSSPSHCAVGSESGGAASAPIVDRSSPGVVGTPVRAGGQHGTPVEVEHQPIGLVGRDHPLCRHSRRRPARLDRVGSQPTTSVRVYTESPMTGNRCKNFLRSATHPGAAPSAGAHQVARWPHTAAPSREGAAHPMDCGFRIMLEQPIVEAPVH